MPSEKTAFRIGIGYDVHRLVKGRPLVLGGVRIPHELGLIGHSDADVLLHAIIDAMLGAAALGDIGLHFPDTESEWKNADSGVLLEKAKRLVEEEGYSVANIDATLAVERPRIRPYISDMQRSIALRLGIDSGHVNVKATTTERLGFEGREEGVSAYAVCLLMKQSGE